MALSEYDLESVYYDVKPNTIANNVYKDMFTRELNANVVKRLNSSLHTLPGNEKAAYKDTVTIKTSDIVDKRFDDLLNNVLGENHSTNNDFEF